MDSVLAGFFVTQQEEEESLILGVRMTDRGLDNIIISTKPYNFQLKYLCMTDSGAGLYNQINKVLKTRR